MNSEKGNKQYLKVLLNVYENFLILIFYFLDIKMILIKININFIKIGYINYRLLNYCDKMINLKFFFLLFLKY